MVFVRVAACPLRCRYCDTPHSYAVTPRSTIAGRGGRRPEPNPVAAERAREIVFEVEAASRFGPRPAAEPLRVSITGGEPLLWPGFVRALGETLHRDGARVHLETAATDPEALAHALPGVDHVSADWKLPETLQGRSYETEHRECVALAAAAGRTLDVKLVVPRGVVAASVQRALEGLLPWRSALLLIVQPVTPFGAVTEAPTAAELAQVVAGARERGFAVRVIPQTHKVLGVE